MMLGMSYYTFSHVLLSLIAILSGLVVVCGFLTARALPGWTGLFLLTSLATTLGGFGFPYHGFTPAIGVGIVSTVILLAVIAARYLYHLAGSWRPIYIIGGVVALYLNVFVLVVQAFLKVPALHVLAPKGSEPPFAIAQGVVLVAFVIVGVLSLRRFRGVAVQT